MSPKNIKKLIKFLKEIAKLKNVERKVLITNKKRWESTAEHSFDLAMWVWILSPYLPKKLDLAHTMKLVLMHDLVEIYAGDIFFFDYKKKEKKKMLEDKAAKKLFALASPPIKKEFTKLWHEFEAKRTKEAKVASSIDHLQPILQNILTDGYSWRKNKITEEFIQEYKRKYMEHDPFLMEFYNALIKDAKRAKII